MVEDLDPRRARVFGAMAEQYERTRPRYPDEAVDWLVPPGARRVADVGAGTGKLTGMLLERGLAVDAVEPDPAMLTVLTRQHPTAHAVLAGAEDLPLPASSVDAVLVAQAWHWFPHQAALAQVRRVLRPDGWLGLLWNVDTAAEPWQHALAGLSPDSAATDPDDDEAELPQFVGLPVDTEHFAWTERLTPQALRDRLATHSGFAVLPALERDRRLDACATIAEDEATRLGGDSVPLRQVTHCFRVHLKEQ